MQFLYKIITLYELFKKKSLTLHRKIRFTPECPIGCSNGGMVDTRDLKSLGHCGCAGSSPASSTRPDSYSVNCPAAVFITAYGYGFFVVVVYIVVLMFVVL